MSNHRLYLEWYGDKNYGNTLVSLIIKLGYKLFPFDIDILKSEKEKYNNNLLKKLVVAGFSSGNIMMISIGLWSSNVYEMGVITRNLLYWLSALIALPAIIYSGQVFFISAWKVIKNKSTNMDVPISVAIIVNICN